MAKSNSPKKQQQPKKVPGQEPVVPQPQTDDENFPEDGEEDGEGDDDEQDPPGGTRPVRPPNQP